MVKTTRIIHNTAFSVILSAKFRIYLLYFIVFFSFSGLNSHLYAGTIQITPSNYSTAGLYYSTSGGNLINDATGFYTNTSTVEWIISGFNIKYGQQWANLKVTVTPGSGSTFDLYIYSGSQAIYSSITQNKSQNIDMTASNFASLKNTSAFTLKIVLNPGTTPVKITDITATYTGNSLYCFPSPYQIANGSMTLVFEVLSESKVTLEIYDSRGRLVKTLFTDKLFAAGGGRGSNTSTWDGKDSTGRKVNTGVYNAVIRVNPANASLIKDKYISTFRVLVYR
ncbi:MAG: hypothetical protein OEV66_03075 [Spirochaetia bacterium]|nr:hypothetical protein [Spirochaetia bacterium]